MTKLHLRVDAAAAAQDDVEFAENVDYADGAKALRFDEDGAGFIYYKSGNVAVCVSRFSDYQKKFFFYGDDTKGTLIGFSSEYSEGFALSSDKKILWNLNGGSIVGSNGSIQREWRWDSTKQNAGHPPTEPVTVFLNEALQCTFLSRQECSFKFSAGGVVREFDCSEKLRRYDSYLENSSKGDTGKVNVAIPNQMTLQDRLAQKLEAGKLQRARLNPRSDMISNSAMSGVMKSLEDHFHSYEQKVKNDKSSSKVDPATLEATPDSHFFATTSIGGDWQGDANKMTTSEVERIKDITAKKLAAENDEDDRGEGDDDSFFWQKKNGKLMNNIEVLEALLKQNPVLAQPAVVANASGRYLAGSRPPSKKPKMRKLLELSHRNFDDVVKGSPDKVVFVAAMRAEVGACRKAQLILELAHGQLYDDAIQAQNASGSGRGSRRNRTSGSDSQGVGGGSTQPGQSDGGSGAGGSNNNDAAGSQEKDVEPELDFVMCRFDMAGSRLLLDRYGVQAVPTYLMFHNGNLVYGGSLGGAPITLETGREPPMVMLVEPAIKDQLIIEKIMKKSSVRCDLALSPGDVQHHVQLQRSVGLGKGKRKFHGIVILGDQLSDSEVSNVTSTFASMDGTLFVSLCPRQSLPVAKNVVYRVTTGRDGSQRVRTAQQYKRSSENANKKPLVCLSTGVVWNARQEQLRGGKAHVAVMKPFKPATLAYLVTRWKRQDFHDPTKSGGKSGNSPDHLSAEHMGLSAATVISKLKEALENGRQGRYLPEDSKFGLSLSSGEATVRGTVLKK